MNEPELNPEEQQDFAKAQEREHTRPPTTFRGQPLLPYTRGTRTVYWQVTTGQNTVVFHDLAFLFIHTRPRSELVKLAWDLEQFRTAILDFADGLTDEEEAQAHQVRIEALKIEDNSEVVPDESQKKTDAG